MKQTRQMEFRVRKEEEKINQAAKQLVEENDRSNEELLAQKRNEKFRLESTIDAVRAKTAQIKPINLDAERQRYEAELQQQKEYFDFCSDLDTLKALIELHLAKVQYQHVQGALDSAQRQKQPILKTVLNDQDNEIAQLNKRCEDRILDVERRLEELCALKDP